MFYLVTSDNTWQQYICYEIRTYKNCATLAVALMEN